MNVGDTVEILPSIALFKMKLGELIGTCGIISDVVVKHGVIIGCWVETEHKVSGYEEEIEWFIPYISLV